MSERTAISWCDSTFNPWLGCTKVSPACDHCYAERLMDHRMRKVHWGTGQPRVRTSAANWRKPLQWEREHEAFALAHDGRRRRVFCASLADVFDNEVPAELRRDLFGFIERTPNLDWLLLTKRIGNVLKMCDDAMAMKPVDASTWPLPNVWLGATICNQEEADRDIPKLLAAPARVRFLSIEPMLGAVDLRRIVNRQSDPPRGEVRDVDPWSEHDALTGVGISSIGFERAGGPRLSWVICGGESGPQARPMHPDWVRSLRDQCAAAGVPFHFKQWGEWAPGSGFNMKPRAWIDRAGRVVTEHDNFPKGAASGDGWAAVHRAGTKAAGHLLDDVEHNGFPG